MQKAFDTVDHQILLAKLDHYGIHGVSNDRFKSYLSNRNQYVSIHGHESDLAAMNCGIPQESPLGPVLLLSYINDPNQAIKFCNKLANADLKHLVNWLNANTISFNAKKTEMIIFKSKQKKFEGDLKTKLCGKRLYLTESVKYLDVKIDTNLI